MSRAQDVGRRQRRELLDVRLGDRRAFEQAAADDEHLARARDLVQDLEAPPERRPCDEGDRGGPSRSSRSPWPPPARRRAV